MRRSIFIVLAVTAASVFLFVASSYLASRLCSHHLTRPTDDLDWLRVEFDLKQTDLVRIRHLHEAYIPTCQDYCNRIATKKNALQEDLSGGDAATEEVEQKLTEIAVLRAQCQAAMLRHFQEVSQAMPPEPGQRYLAEMQRLTLGYHEQIEASMTRPGSVPHGRH